MRFPRFRIRSLMILVLVSSLVFASIFTLGRKTRLNLERIKEGSILFVPFFIAVKFGLVFRYRARRASAADPITTTLREDSPT